MYSSDLCVREVRRRPPPCADVIFGSPARAHRAPFKFASLTLTVDGWPGRRGGQAEWWTRGPAFDNSITACSLPKTDWTRRRSSRSEGIRRDAPLLAINRRIASATHGKCAPPARRRLWEVL